MENILKEKSFLFALRVVKLAQYLNSDKKEYVLSKQVLRSGTSIGALICEAEYAQSKPDFIHKLSIGLKEANETKYWLRLLKDCNYLNNKTSESLLDDIEHLIKMLSSSTKTAKENLKNEK